MGRVALQFTVHKLLRLHANLEHQHHTGTGDDAITTMRGLRLQPELEPSHNPRSSQSHARTGIVGAGEHLGAGHCGVV